eukprot:8955240-Pyramimonas_sp.AAC.1
MGPEWMGSEDRAAFAIRWRCIGDAWAMHVRCIVDVGDAPAKSAWTKSGSTSSHIVDASAMRRDRDPPTPSTPTPSRRPR